jgi:hypothetical protein
MVYGIIDFRAELLCYFVDEFNILKEEEVW